MPVKWDRLAFPGTTVEDTSVFVTNFTLEHIVKSLSASLVPQVGGEVQSAGHVSVTSRRDTMPTATSRLDPVLVKPITFNLQAVTLAIHVTAIPSVHSVTDVTT